MQGQILLVSQIVAQGTKVNSWEIHVTKVDTISFVMASNRHLAPFVDFILNLG